MAKTETNVSTLKINRGTYAKVQENLSSITENELIITSDKNVPIPTTNDSGKAVVVNASGEYELGNAGMTNPMTTAGDIIVGGADGTPTRLSKPSEARYQFLASNRNGNLIYTDIPITNIQIGQSSAQYKVAYANSDSYAINMSLGIPAVDFGLGYLTSAPSSANTNGLKIVVLTSEPATYYDGYYYVIAPST